MEVKSQNVEDATENHNGEFSEVQGMEKVVNTTPEIKTQESQKGKERNISSEASRKVKSVSEKKTKEEEWQDVSPGKASRSPNMSK